MVLATALHQVRHNEAIVYRNDRDAEGVYLFATDFPEYDRRMEAIATVARMWIGWDIPHLALAAI